MLNKKVIFTLIILVLVLISFNVLAEEEKALEEKVLEKIGNYEESVTRGERMYDKLVEEQGIGQAPDPIPYYDDSHEGFGFDYDDSSYLEEGYDSSYLGRTRYVEIPVKYTSRYGEIRFKILTGKPLTRIQFGTDYRFVFKLSEKYGIVLTEAQVEKIFEEDKVYTVEKLVDIGDLAYLNGF